MNPYLMPAIDEVARPFWDGCRDGELRVQRCVDTGRLLFPPRPRSPWGHRRAPEWVPVSGLGRIWSFVVPHPPLLERFLDAAPYNVIVVALDEDPTVRMVGNLVPDAGGALGEIDPATIVIGEPVRVVFDRIDEQLSMPRWVRA